MFSPGIYVFQKMMPLAAARMIKYVRSSSLRSACFHFLIRSKKYILKLTPNSAIKIATTH